MTTDGDVSRERFLADSNERRRAHFHKTASTYHQRYGGIDQTHHECAIQLLGMVEAGQEILDAACGTGKYFPLILESGHRVFGIDDSPEMLAEAEAVRPDVATRRMALQDLHAANELHGRFAGLLCVDSMEWVLRDDWPLVLAGFSSCLRPASPVYLTVERPGAEEQVALDSDRPIGAKEREIAVHEWYNHFPRRDEVLGWLSDAGFAVVAERTDEWYLHLVLRSP